MRTEADHAAEAGTQRGRRRQAAKIISRSLLVATAVIVGYFVLPLSSRLAIDTLVELGIGLAVIAGLLTWQVRNIIRSPFPAVQAIAAMVVVVPMFLILFATSYYIMGDADPSNFSEPMSKLDSVYFTVTMFATVGFGDITAVSEGARAIVTVQMVLGLVLVGLVARVLFSAVQAARDRQSNDRPR